MGNRLASSLSPYLRQHADDPVDWREFGREALEEARAKDVPLFVSVGYAACHWCHVMAKESFRDEEVAEILNTRFIPVKVDREENPAIDSLMMEAVLVLNGSGGWPLSVFCLPDGRPFWGGTYFPPRPTGSLPSFVQVLRAIDEAWRTRRADAEESARAIQEAVARRKSLSGPATLRMSRSSASFHELVEAAASELERAFDREWGGFFRAPKFPQAPLLQLALDLVAAGHKSLREPLETTLKAYCLGPLFDQVDGGFFRYCVDRRFTTPHYEKMLYDQALLIKVLSRAYTMFPLPEVKRAIEMTVDFSFRELSVGSAFASSLDADAAGKEGGTYLLSREELGQILAEGQTEEPESTGLVSRTSEGGFLPDLRAVGSPDDPAAKEFLSKLAELRRAKPRPSRDDKVVAEYNYMMASALAEAGARLGRPAWIERAVACREACNGLLTDEEGALHRAWRGGRVSTTLAGLCDHAWLGESASAIAQWAPSAHLWGQAAEAIKTIEREFRDDEAPDFLDHRPSETLGMALRERTDNATPAGNSIVAELCLDLYSATAEGRYLEVAEGLIESVNEVMSSSPLAFPWLVCQAIRLAVGPVQLVVPGAEPHFAEAAAKAYLPGIVVVQGLAPGLVSEGKSEGKAYLCHRFSCSSPASDPTELQSQLSSLLQP